jgi:hypothetical protein
MFVSKFNFTMFLGLNMGTMLIEAFQYPLTLSPVLLEMGASYKDAMLLPATLAKSSAKSNFTLSGRGKDLAGTGWKDKSHRFIIKRAAQEGRLNIRRHLDIDDDHVVNRETASRIAKGEDMRGELDTVNPAKLAYRAGARAYAPFNRFNAELSLVSAFEVLKKKNPDWSLEKLYLESVKWADIANGSAGKANRPIGLFTGRTDVMSSVGMGANSLLSFSNAQISNWMRWMKKSNGGGQVFTKGETKNAQRALAYATASTLMGLGAMGLPLVASLNTLFANLFGMDLQEAIRGWLTDEDDLARGETSPWADMANYGAMHAVGLSPDIQTRLAIGGLGGLTPYEGVSTLALFGPGASWIESAAVALQEAPKQGFAKTAVNMGPVGLRRGLNMILNGGDIHDRKNNYVMTPTTAEKAAAIMGFAPLRARKESIRRTEERRHIAQDRRKVDHATHEALQHVRANDIVSARRVLFNTATEIPGKSYANIYQSFEDKFLRNQYGRSYDSGGNTSQRVTTMSGLPRPSNMQVYGTKLGLRGAFGFDPTPTRSELYLNSRADQIRRTMPYISPAQAKSFARAETQTDPQRQAYSGGFRFAH